jgi:hypothetical protein
MIDPTLLSREVLILIIEDLVKQLHTLKTCSVPEPSVPSVPSIPHVLSRIPTYTSFLGGPSVPEPSVPEPSVPEPSVPEPSVPEPSVPEPSVPSACMEIAEKAIQQAIADAKEMGWPDLIRDGEAALRLFSKGYLWLAGQTLYKAHAHPISPVSFRMAWGRVIQAIDEHEWPSAPSVTEPSEPGSSEPGSSEPEPSAPEPSEPESSEPEPSVPEPSVPEPSDPPACMKIAEKAIQQAIADAKEMVRLDLILDGEAALRLFSKGYLWFAGQTLHKTCETSRCPVSFRWAWEAVLQAIDEHDEWLKNRRDAWLGSSVPSVPEPSVPEPSEPGSSGPGSSEPDITEVLAGRIDLAEQLLLQSLSAAEQLGHTQLQKMADTAINQFAKRDFQGSIQTLYTAYGIPGSPGIFWDARNAVLEVIEAAKCAKTE